MHKINKAAVLAAAVMIAAASAGCSKDTETKTQTTAAAETTAATESDVSSPSDTSANDAALKEKFDSSTLLAEPALEDMGTAQLCDLNKISFSVDKKASVTDESVTDYIDSERSNHMKEEDRAVQNGDTVDIDFNGMIDGKDFDNNTATGWQEDVGQEHIGPGFDAALVGKKKGDSFTVSVSYPSDYGSEILAGKKVDFTVTINKVTSTPELNDDYVKSLSIDGVTTVDEYKAYAKKKCEEQNDSDYDSNLKYKAFQYVTDNSTITLSDKMKEYAESYVINMYKDQFKSDGTDLDTVLKNYGQSMTDFWKNIDESADSYGKWDFTIKKIASDEKLIVTDDDINTMIKNMELSDGVEYTKDSFIKKYSEDEMNNWAQEEKVLSYLQKKAEITYTDPTTEAAKSAQTPVSESIVNDATETVPETK